MMLKSIKKEGSPLSNNQFIVFNLGEEQYGINISYTKEIVRIPKITPIPNMPVFIEGVINLRDTVIPVIDLKKKFGFKQTERNLDNRLLILDFEESSLGVIVDDVSEVVEINEGAIEKLDAEIATIGGNSLEGIAKIDHKLILLLNALEFKSDIFQIIDERVLA